MVGKRWIKGEGKGRKEERRTWKKGKKMKREMARKTSENNVDINYLQYTEKITTHRVLSINSMYSKSYGHINMKVK